MPAPFPAFFLSPFSNVNNEKKIKLHYQRNNTHENDNIQSMILRWQDIEKHNHHNE